MGLEVAVGVGDGLCDTLGTGEGGCWLAGVPRNNRADATRLMAVAAKIKLGLLFGAGGGVASGCMAWRTVGDIFFSTTLREASLRSQRRRAWAISSALA